MTNDQWVVVLFGILYFSIIIFKRRRGTFEEFSVAGRNLGTFLIFSSICASHIDASWTIGLTREGFTDGLFLAMIAPITGLGTAVIAIFFTAMVRRKFKDSYSLSDIVAGPLTHDNKMDQSCGRESYHVICIGIIHCWKLCRE